MNNACVRIVVTHARRYNDYVDGESERRKSEIKSSGHSNVTLQTLIPPFVILEEKIHLLLKKRKQYKWWFQ